MRTLRLSLMGMLTLALLGGPSAMVVAQDDPMAPAFVTGSITQGSPSSSGTGSIDEYGANITTGFVGPADWEASDPRLSGTETYTGNWRRFATAGFNVQASTRVVENADGRWVGTATALPGPDYETDTVILHGEDAYEGLTAYALIDFRVFPIEFVAAIFPGEMPPFPEPAE
jgi:hypothetical protein